MRVGILPAPGRTLTSLDSRTRADVEAYAQAFEVVDLAQSPALARTCDVTRVMNLARCWPALYAKLRHHTPYILTLGYDHALLTTIAGHRAKAVAWRALRTLACFYANGLLVSAEDLATRWRLRERFPHTPIAVVPNGVDLMRFWPGRPTPDRVIYVGRLSPEKNLLRLVEACAGTGITLELVGDGPLRAQIAEAAHRHRVPCFLPGQVSYEEVASRLAGAAAFCLPSWAEGSPKALFEAMATALPCVVSDRIPDVGGMPVIQCDPASTQDLASGLRIALTSPELGRKAREYVEARHDLRQTLAQEIAFVREVAGR